LIWNQKGFAMRSVLLPALAAVALVFASAANPPQPAVKTSDYASLRTAEANGRRGPHPDQPVVWKYQQRGLPVKVLGKSGEFRWIEDPLGDKVWMHASQISDRRTVFVLGQGKDGGDPAPLLAKPRAERKVVARLERGVIARLLQCESGWRKIELIGRKGKDKQGWIKADLVWGGADCVGGAPKGA
jgi:SH3-like domain-containing protein